MQEVRKFIQKVTPARPLQAQRPPFSDYEEAVRLSFPPQKSLMTDL